jgi:pimeloyl-ACP methyl ester carboxylesterase
MSLLGLRVLILIVLILYQVISAWQEDRTPPPGQRVNLGGYHLHYVTAGTGQPTIILDHSLGGIEGYLLFAKLANISRVCIYDRAGFGWSDRSPKPRTSSHMVTELNTMLMLAGIDPPYILVGDSLGSYNMRLYAHRYPEKVSGLVLTDGLHESGMLRMSWPLRGLQVLFTSGFMMSVLGAGLGIVRLLNWIGLFECLKPELRQCSPTALQAVKRSFCRPKHWLTMAQEIWNLDTSGREIQEVKSLGDLPVISLKSQSFFRASLLTRFLPLGAINDLRDRMHHQLSQLSSNVTQINLEKSGHFVWVDQPDAIVNAVQHLKDQCL